MERLKCMKEMKMERSNADPCLYYKWTDNGLSLMMSCIDVILIMGNEEVAEETEKNLMDRFDCSGENN